MLRRELLPGLTITFVAVFVALAVVFANAQGSERVAEDGSRAVQAEATLGVAAAARNAIVQAEIVAIAAEEGLAPQDEATTAMDNATAVILQFEARVEALAEALGHAGTTSLTSATQAFDVASNAAMAALTSGDTDAASSIIDGQLDQSYRSAASELAAERDRLVQSIGLARSSAGRVAQIAGFLVAFLVPLAALLLFRLVTRRNEKRLALEQELEKQRAIGRTKDESIANLSHELRTPLTAIYGFALTILDMEPADRAHADDMLGVIAGESAELSRMVDDLLTAAAADHHGVAVTIEQIDPVAEIEEVLAPWAATGVEIAVEAADALVAVDRLRLRQVLRNLVSNALRHGRPEVAIRALTTASGYRIEVIDHGDGVSPEIESRLFKRFLHDGSSPLLTGSVGLGLSIARLLTETMEGDIDYERRDGQTVFSVTFPLAAAVGTEAKEAA
ncbi:MAG: HAMP domain-containing histidine kinase [Acidimicrobiia bacterium]|nr:HAMP domain-containing histidine kinase [Acidimicrobiia bacterium]MDH3470050.1 HAMP domain-containing histidine kinase [Acidimicrobiia bacterium]